MFTFQDEIINLWIYAKFLNFGESINLIDAALAVVISAHILFMEILIFRKIKDETFMVDDKYEAIKMSYI